MGILEDLAALGKDVADPAAVADGIRLVAADPAGRMKLIQEWEAATGRPFPPALTHDLTAPGPVPP